MVRDVWIREAPAFNHEQRFLMASPVFLKRKTDNKHLTFKDKEFEQALTENLKTKLTRAGINSEGVQVCLDSNSSYRSTKLVTYHGIGNKTTLAPLVIKGTPEQIAFAWDVGLGHSTGIGFGALK